VSQYIEGMALAANCSIKGSDVVCKKCGRSLPDTCGDKHPRAEVIEEEVLAADEVDPDADFEKARESKAPKARAKVTA
jgi:hypothetical protein